MKTRYWLLLLFTAVFVIVLTVYAFLPEWQAPIGDTIALGRDFIIGQATAFSVWFQTLPYWPVLGMVITYAVGMLTWWKIDTIQHALHFWGYDKSIQRFRTKPSAAPPQSIRNPPPQTDNTVIPTPLPVEEEKATEITTQ